MVRRTICSQQMRQLLQAAIPTLLHSHVLGIGTGAASQGDERRRIKPGKPEGGSLLAPVVGCIGPQGHTPMASNAGSNRLPRNQVSAYQLPPLPSSPNHPRHSRNHTNALG